MATRYVKTFFQAEVTEYAYLRSLGKQEAFEELREEVKSSSVERRC